MNYKQLKDLFWKQEREHPEKHLTACITFSSFGPDNEEEYSWQSRTYVISSDNKAFQPGKGGYSIFGSCLDGTDRCLRLDRRMREESGGKDGWVIEDCLLVGYLLIESNDSGGSSAEMFYSHEDAADRMLSLLAEKSGRDAEKLKADYSAKKTPFEDDVCGAEMNHAWLRDSCEDWYWNIQLVYIRDVLNMAFADPTGHVDGSEGRPILL